jgi:hypothetical protein
MPRFKTTHGCSTFHSTYHLTISSRLHRYSFLLIFAHRSVIDTLEAFADK